MIIDAHAHWYRPDTFWPQDVWPTIIDAVYSLIPSGATLSPEGLKEILWDVDGSKLIHTMDEAGIDKTILYPVDFGIYYQKEPVLDFWEANKLHSELAKTNPDRIYTYFGIDPRREKAAYYFAKAIEEWGNIKGLKIYPPCGFYPYDERCDELYRICENHNIPVLTHGGESPYSETQYCQAKFFEPVLKKFPRLKLIYAHLGWTTMFEEAVNLLCDYENVYADISAWQVFTDEQVINKLEYIDQRVGLDKVMFGSDAPNFTPFVTMNAWVDRINSLALPSDVKAKIMSETAIKVHKL